MTFNRHNYEDTSTADIGIRPSWLGLRKRGVKVWVRPDQEPPPDA